MTFGIMQGEFGWIFWTQGYGGGNSVTEYDTEAEAQTVYDRFVGIFGQP